MSSWTRTALHLGAHDAVLSCSILQLDAPDRTALTRLGQTKLYGASARDRDAGAVLGRTLCHRAPGAGRRPSSHLPILPACSQVPLCWKEDGGFVFHCAPHRVKGAHRAAASQPAHGQC